MKVTRCHKLISLSFFEVVLLAEATVLVIAFDIALRLFPAKTCLDIFKAKAVPQRRRQRADPQRMAWLVDVADRYVPGRSSCLRQAVTLSCMLRRRGVATSFRIGVTREGDTFGAHSWLESESGEVIGLSDTDKYAPLSSPGVQQPLQTGSEQ